VLLVLNSVVGDYDVLGELANFFRLAEQASDPKLGSENWALFMEICDLINESEES
jgi:hypothetical protein